MFRPEGTVRVVAAYESHESIFQVGTEIAVDITPLALESAALVVRGRPVVMKASEEFGLLRDVLLREGLDENLGVPLRRMGVVAGMLVLGASGAGAFDGALDYAAALGAAIEERMLDLVDASGRA